MIINKAKINVILIHYIEIYILYLQNFISTITYHWTVNQTQ